MNTTKIITIICWAISAIVLIGLIIWFLTGSIIGIGTNFRDINIFGFNFGGIQSLSGPFTSQGTQTADTTGIDSINISWVAGDVILIPHDGSAIEVTESAQRDLRDNERLQMSTSGGTLTIRFRERLTTGRTPRKNLEVLVPQNLSKNLTKLTISTTSGNVKTEDFNAETVNLSSVSADIQLADFVSNIIDVSTTSGKVTANDVRAGLLDISSVSGDITTPEAIATTLKISTTSGRTNASGSFERVNVSSISGNTTIKSTAIPDTINISSVSGNIDVHIPNNANLPNNGEITVSHSAVSGRFASEVPVRMQNGAPYSFSSVSGDTNIHALG